MDKSSLIVSHANITHFGAIWPQIVFHVKIDEKKVFSELEFLKNRKKAIKHREKRFYFLNQ